MVAVTAEIVTVFEVALWASIVPWSWYWRALAPTGHV
jgi:hypothetical protein